MTKLNYASRRAFGAKMGTTASRDIQRRATATLNARGSSTTKDPALELILSGKQLGDEGIQILCKALLESTATGGVKVEELNLSDNELELSSLRYIGEVIKVTPGLRDLDLSKNKIYVETDEDAAEWTKFLKLFKGCHSMRLLNFSGNPMGDRAYEVFLRVYASESPLTVPKKEIWQRVLNFGVENSLDHHFDETVVSKLKDFKLDENSHEISRVKQQQANGDTPQSTDSSADPSRKSSNTTSPSNTIFSKGTTGRESPATPPSIHGFQLRGLRAIPYIVFSDAGVTDAGAMWLSYVVERHPLPADLLPHLPLIKDGPQIAIFKALDEVAGCDGVVWNENPKMSGFGSELLQLAERCRVDDGGDEDTDVEEPFNEVVQNKPGSEGTISTTSVAGSTTPLKASNRRYSNAKRTPLSVYKSGRKDSFQERNELSLAQELEKARFKIQSVVLRDAKLARPELWQTVIRMLVVSRAIFCGYDHSIELEPKDGGNDEDEKSSIVTLEMCQPSLDTISEGVFRLVPPKVDTTCLPVMDGSGNISSNGLYSDALRRNSKSSYHGEEASPPYAYKNGNGLTRLMRTNIGPPPGFPVPSPATKIRPPPGFEAPKVQATASSAVNGKDSNPIPGRLPGMLPLHLWGRIIAMAEDPLNLTCKSQRDSIYSYAQSRETLAKESEFIGKTTSVQIRKVLEQVDGLEYEIQ